ncbi:MAG: hypothetical protein ACI802_000677 [Candidatus Paceibacteria bacterium]|jgi:hypothetical protein
MAFGVSGLLRGNEPNIFLFGDFRIGKGFDLLALFVGKNQHQCVACVDDCLRGY